MTHATQRLMHAVRQACPATVWSQGIEINRLGAVHRSKIAATSEVELRIVLQTGAKSPTVVLYLEDAEWSCDCTSPHDACEHVVAASIAYHHNAAALPLFVQQTAVHWHYFIRVMGGLSLKGHDILSAKKLSSIFETLQHSKSVQLDGIPIDVGEAQCVMRARLEKHPGGAMLRVVQDARVCEVFNNGAVCWQDDGRMYLCAIKDIQLDYKILQTLRAGEFIRQADMHMLHHTLASLRQKMPVDIIGIDLSNIATSPAQHAVLQTSISYDNNIFNIEFASTANSGKKQHAAVQDVLQAYQEGRDLVPLLEGGFARIPNDFLYKHTQLIIDLLDARDKQGKLLPCVLPDLAHLLDDLDMPQPAGLKDLQAALAHHEHIPQAILPTDLTANLRPYQQQGVNWLHFLKQTGMGALLADDMGLGKTLQTLCVLEKNTLVIAPTSVLRNWQQEIKRFRPQLSCVIYHGTDRAIQPDADITLSTYAILRLDIDILKTIQWHTVVLDEAQYIKNAQSQVAQAAYQLHAQWRISLTGTPIENNLDELWSQFHFLNRGLLKNRRLFQERYSIPIQQGIPDVAKQLYKRIKPFILRRMKNSVAPELPARTTSILRCTLADNEQHTYNAIYATTKADVLKKLQIDGNIMQALEALLRLRQACCHTGLLPGQYANNSSKIDLLLETLQQVLIDDHKALIFSQWTTLLDLIEPVLTKHCISFNRLDGSTKDRQSVVNRFQATDGPQVMLLSLKAGGTGLNLTAADHVFLLDPWWNPAVEDQAADRAYRIGQHRPVFVYKLIAQDTVEERIIELQERKRQAATATLSGAEQAVSLSRNDLLSLFD